MNSLNSCFWIFYYSFLTVSWVHSSPLVLLFYLTTYIFFWATIISNTFSIPSTHHYHLHLVIKQWWPPAHDKFVVEWHSGYLACNDNNLEGVGAAQRGLSDTADFLQCRDSLQPTTCSFHMCRLYPCVVYPQLHPFPFWHLKKKSVL